MSRFGPHHRYKANRRYLDGTRRFAYGHSYLGVPNLGRDVIGIFGGAPSMGSAERPKQYRTDADYLWEGANRMYNDESKNLP